MSQHRRISRSRAGRWPALALATVGLLIGPSASAAGFGQLRLQSHIGQPLQAEIDIDGLTPDDGSAIRVTLASPETYARAGLAYPAMLSGAQWRLERQADGSYVARLRSSEPVSESFVDLLVEMSWPGGRATRSYTVLLEPAGATAPAEPERTAEPMIVQPEGAPGLAGAQPASDPGASRHAAGAGAGAYTVQRGDHLYGIAESLMPRGDAVSLDQMVVALFRANPRAFIAGNMNRLKAGAVLKLPGEADVRAVAPGEARRELVAHTKAFDAYRRRLADAAEAAVPTRGNGQQQAGRITARVDDAGAPAGGPRDELTLSKPDSASATRPGTVPQAGAEDEVARERQLREAEARLAQLRRNVDDIERLLELKSAEMARAGQQGGAGASSDGPALPTGTTVPRAARDEGIGGASPNRPAAANDWLSGPYVLPAGGALLALLAGYGLYRRQRSRAAFSGPGAGPGAAGGPLVFGDLTLPLDAFPAADDDAGKARRPDAGSGSGPSTPAPQVWLDDEADDGAHDPAATKPRDAAMRPASAQPRPPAFDFGGLSLDLDGNDVPPPRGDGPDGKPRDPGQGGERA